MTVTAQARRRSRGYGGTLLRVALLVALIAGLVAAGWVYARQWAPSRDDYPMQGLSVGEAHGAIDWRTVRARHADFAYLTASSGADIRDSRFAVNWADARAAGLRYGAVHNFSLCDRAVDQATLFIATVPRDNAALPPVVRLDFRADCAARPSRDTVLSALNTFLNLIEAHEGKQAVVRVSRAFDDRYDVGKGIYRTLWLEGDFLAPDYASRPWVMWTASTMRQLDGIDAPVEWNVVKP